jgi:DNA-binding transcriptional LysR family regulator
MNLSRLARIDLNLLVALHILLQEGSVSRAADRLSITQPAMSKTLGRLRDTFDDPLFVRSKRGIQPTPRALGLAGELKSILGQIDGLLDAGDFSPAAFKGEITLAISEYVGFTLLPPLSARLQSHAPRLRLRTITRAERQLDQLASGELDFAIQIQRDEYPPEYSVSPLAASPLAIFVRQDHPLVAQTLTSQMIRQFPQVALYVADREELIGGQTLARNLFESDRGTLETSHLLTAFEILRETDYVLICPAYLARNEGATRDIAALTLPVDMTFNVQYSLIAHKRTEQSPVHQWLWQEIVNTVQSMRFRTVHRG